MKILFFADSLPPATDGVSRTLVNLVNTLTKKKIEFLFVSPFRPNGLVSWSDRVYKVRSLPFLLYSAYRIGMPISKKVRTLLDEFAPDIVHCTSPTLLGKTGLNYATKNDIPAVSSYHTDFVSYFKYYGFGLVEDLGWKYLRWFYNQFSRVYVPSNNTREELLLRGFVNTDIWPRGIDIARFSPNFRNSEIRNKIAPKNEAVLLFVGRLVKEKDLEDLIVVDRILTQNKQRFKFVFVGDGPLKPLLQKELPQAIYTGYLYGEELARWYASSDIFVFPSTTETFGNVILEAYASGLPVIGVNVGGVLDLLKDGQTGYVSRANDPKHFAQKIQNMLENKALRKKYGENALAVAKQFSWHTINSRLIDSYQEVIDAYKK